MRLIAFSPLLLALFPAVASADACESVKAAYDKLATAPAYRQSMTMEGMPDMHMVMIGDTLYMEQTKDKWTKMPLEPGMRAKMMHDLMPEASALKDCQDLGAEVVDGVAATVFAYTPPPIGGIEQGAQKVWVADADGLPRRMTAEQEGKPMEVTIGYEDVTAPVE